MAFVTGISIIVISITRPVNCCGIQAYTWLLQRVPPALMATHTYANPMVAVILGWLLAHEASMTRVVLASVAILGAIVLIRRGEREATVKPPGAVPTVAEIRTSEECA